ncbi:MAG: UTRA domain-containing protein, partial [Actinomycetota bacterium]
EVDWTHTALYDELAKIGVTVPNQGWERLTPIVPGAEDRARLELSKSDAAFFLERLGTRDGQAIEWRTTVIRGDRYRFVTDWSTGSRSELKPAAI